MAAFRLAVQRGVGGMECDVYATADGVPVIMHDESMSRTTGVAAKITELTADVVTNTAATAATKDRVVFISFAPERVQQVRAALPDYPAWLLASNVENVPAATLIAKAQACNATGVDVSGTFDAAYVAAVRNLPT